MNKLQTRGIVIIAGAIATFLLIRFLQIQPPVGNYFSGYTLSYSIIAVLALIFGPVVGGAIGLLAILSSEILNIIRLTMQIYSFYYGAIIFIIYMIFVILVTGLYGFIIGKLFENKTIGADNRDAARIIGLFSLSAFGFFVVVQIILRFLNYIFYQLIFPNSSFFTVLNQELLTQWIIRGSIIGCISFVIVFICHKYLKFNIPL
jgi:uncharacterized membrane protein